MIVLDEPIHIPDVNICKLWCVMHDRESIQPRGDMSAGLLRSNVRAQQDESNLLALDKKNCAFYAAAEGNHRLADSERKARAEGAEDLLGFYTKPVAEEAIGGHREPFEKASMQRL